MSGETGKWERMMMLYRRYRNGLGEEGAGDAVFPCHSISHTLLEAGRVFKHKSETSQLHPWDQPPPQAPILGALGQRCCF